MSVAITDEAGGVVFIARSFVGSASFPPCLAVVIGLPTTVVAMVLEGGVERAVTETTGACVVLLLVVSERSVVNPPPDNYGVTTTGLCVGTVVGVLVTKGTTVVEEVTAPTVPAMFFGDARTLVAMSITSMGVLPVAKVGFPMVGFTMHVMVPSMATTRTP